MVQEVRKAWAPRLIPAREGVLATKELVVDCATKPARQVLIAITAAAAFRRRGRRGRPGRGTAPPTSRGALRPRRRRPSAARRPKGSDALQEGQGIGEGEGHQAGRQGGRRGQEAGEAEARRGGRGGSGERGRHTVQAGTVGGTDQGAGRQGRCGGQEAGQAQARRGDRAGLGARGRQALLLRQGGPPEAEHHLPRLRGPNARLGPLQVLLLQPVLLHLCCEDEYRHAHRAARVADSSVPKRPRATGARAGRRSCKTAWARRGALVVGRAAADVRRAGANWQHTATLAPSWRAIRAFLCVHCP